METVSTIVGGITRYWWTFVLRGVLAVLFGIGAFVWPEITLVVLVTLFGVFAIADGVLSIAAAFAPDQFRWSHLFSGLLGIGAGIVAFAWPGLTAVALVYVIAAWAIATGIMEIAAAISLRRVIEGEWYFGFAGVMSILFGTLLTVFPGEGALSLTWLIGTYAIIFGVAVAALGFRLRGMKHLAEVPSTRQRAPQAA